MVAALPPRPPLDDDDADDVVVVVLAILPRRCFGECFGRRVEVADAGAALKEVPRRMVVVVVAATVRCL